MWASSRIAWSEFIVGFSPRSTGAAGVRDFVALAAFFGLMMFLILLGWSVRDGLWGRIEQILLGALPQGQVPIRLGYHIDNTNKINVNVLDEFAQRFPYLTIVPQRSSDGEKGAVILPGLNVVVDETGKIVEIKGPWGLGKKDKRVTAFRIDAIPLATPLWDWILRSGQRSGGAPVGGAAAAAEVTAAAGHRLVAASRHLFEQHFKYDVYREGVLADRLVPCDLKRMLPKTIASVDDISTLVLQVQENIVSPDGKHMTVPSYHAFDVIWVDSFPTPDQTAVVMPLSTFEVLQVSAENKLIAYPAERLTGSQAERIALAKLADIDLETAGIPEFLKLAGCVGAIPVTSSAGDPGTDTCLTTAGGTEELKPPPVVGGACETLRERAPIKFPRLMSNGHDLLICTGEHRRLRGSEVATCTKESGLDDLRQRQPDVTARLELRPAPAGDEIEWLGPSRLAVPCGAMGQSGLVMAKALASDRRIAGPPSASASGSEPAVAADELWVEACTQWNEKQPPGTPGGPPAVVYLEGYQDLTIYANPKADEPLSLDQFKEALESLLSRTQEEDTGSKSLNFVTQQLLSWTTMLGRPAGGTAAPVFSVDPAYESALVRFGVLSVIIEKVSTPLAAGGLALYVFLTSVILSTAIAHRKRQYGLLMMIGINTDKIAYIVSLQIVLSCIVGGIAGAIAFLATSAVVNDLLSTSAMIADARMIIGLDVETFLSPLKWPVIFGLWTAMIFLAVLIGTAMLRLHGITTARAPIELVKS